MLKRYSYRRAHRREDTEKTARNLLIAMSIICIVFLALLSVIVNADVPTGSIEIYGPNGTYVTGTRNVFLNMSFASAAHEIGTCRMANDAASNLNLQHFENCSSVKAWVLSEGFGDKTVFLEVRDLNGDTATFSDSISYVYMQDYTAPTAPTVFDGPTPLTDIDWWGTNGTLYANWFNATEDISTLYYKYRIYENGACLGGSCAWTDVSTDTAVKVTGIDLTEGYNYTFEVSAFNPFLLNATAVSDNVTIDVTDPTTPTVESSSHPIEGNPYNVATVRLNWSSSDPISSNVASGIEGYSYTIDRHPGTAPDNRLEARYWETLEYMHRGAYNQTLKENSTGTAFAVFSQVIGNFSVGDNVRVRAALAEQDIDYGDRMSVQVYLMSIPDGTNVDAYDMLSDAITDPVNVSQDIVYVESMTEAFIYEFDLTVHTGADDSTEDIYAVVAGRTSDDDNRRPLAIAGSTQLVDNRSRNFVCDENNGAGPPDCTENTQTLDYAVEVKKEDSGSSWDTVFEHLGDGDYYFHVKAKDYAGNWGDTAHYHVVVAASGITSRVYSPADGEIFYTNESYLNITASVIVSGNASVYVVAEHAGGGYSSTPQYDINDTGDFTDLRLELGLNEIYAVTNTSVGAVSRSPSIFVRLISEPPQITNRTLRVRYSVNCDSPALQRLCYTAQASHYVGIAVEPPGVVNPAADTATADTSRNSLKVFFTQQFDVDAVDIKLDKNSFLDDINPMFGLKRGFSEYLIRNSLRYDNLYLGGDFIVPPGAYNLHLRKGGMTPDGRNNITIMLE